jgi:hypothetical protein
MELLDSLPQPVTVSDAMAEFAYLVEDPVYIFVEAGQVKRMH